MGRVPGVPMFKRLLLRRLYLAVKVVEVQIGTWRPKKGA